jgi:segregation and condensation protein A
MGPATPPRGFASRRAGEGAGGQQGSAFRLRSSALPELFPEAVEGLGNHPDPGHAGHEIHIAGPPRHDVPVQMPGQAGTGNPAEVEADIEALALQCLFQPATPVSQPQLEVEQLAVCQLGQGCPVVERGDEQVAVGIGVAVEYDDALRRPLDHPKVTVMILRDRRRPAEEAAGLGSGSPAGRLRGGCVARLTFDISQSPWGPECVGMSSVSGHEGEGVRGTIRWLLSYPTAPDASMAALTPGGTPRQKECSHSLREPAVAFKVDLDVFAGPLDLLLYLVKKHEVDVTEVPIARVAEAFVAYLEVLQELAIDQVGEFVELASVLLEIKARALVPRPEEQEEPLEPIREDLVERLLEYKQFRDAAVLLEDRAREWESRFVRAHPEELPRQGPPTEIHFADVQVWDLVGALSRVLQRQERRKPRQIIHDDTPIEVHIERIEQLLAEQGRVAFTTLFDDEMPRMRVVGIFLAALELVRRGRLTTRQDELYGEIWLEPRRSTGSEAQEPA